MPVEMAVTGNERGNGNAGITAESLPEGTTMNDWNTRVAGAAAQLTAEGRKVTADAVRARIGFGSLREICPALRTWRELHRKAEGIEATIPPEVLSAFNAANAAAWSAAGRLADGRIAAIETACQERIQDAEAERDAALNEIASYESQIEVFAKELVDSRDAEKLAFADVARLEAELKAAQEKIETLSQAVEKERQETAVALGLAGELRGRIAAMTEIFDGTQRVLSTRTGG